MTTNETITEMPEALGRLVIRADSGAGLWGRVRRRPPTLAGSHPSSGSSSLAEDTGVSERKWWRMSEALFALAGALVGVLGTVLTTTVGARSEDRRAAKTALRAVCSSFAAEAARVRRLSIELLRRPDDTLLHERVEDALTGARAAYEQLRLISESYGAQEAASHIVHYANWMFWAARGKREGFAEAQVEFHNWSRRLYSEIRRELGLRKPDDVYTDHVTGFPAPTAQIEGSPRSCRSLGRCRRVKGALRGWRA